jgi:hypothetical protein
MASVVRSTALRAGGACVRCRKGKTKCVYEGGRAPCKNCSKGMHDCYLPTDSMSHGAHGVSPARVQQRARESLASERAVSSTAGDRQAPPPSSVSRHVSTTTEKYVLLLPLPSHLFVILWMKSFISSPFYACISGCARTVFFFFPLFFRALRWQRLFSQPAPGCLHPPSPSFIAGSRRASPNFLRPALISQTGTRNFPPCSVRAPSRLTPDLFLALARNERSPSRVELRVGVVAIGCFLRASGVTTTMSFRKIFNTLAFDRANSDAATDLHPS